MTLTPKVWPPGFGQIYRLGVRWGQVFVLKARPEGYGRHAHSQKLNKDEAIPFLTLPSPYLFRPSFPSPSVSLLLNFTPFPLVSRTPPRIVASGSGGTLPQRVRAEPGCQTHLDSRKCIYWQHVWFFYVIVLHVVSPSYNEEVIASSCLNVATALAEAETRCQGQCYLTEVEAKPKSRLWPQGEAKTLVLRPGKD